MKKPVLFLLLVCLLPACSSINMKRTVNNVSRQQVENKMGGYTIIAMPLKKSYLDYLKAMDMQSQISDNRGSEKIQSIEYRDNQFFVFEIRHIHMYVIKEGDFTFTMTDAKGNNQIENIMYFEELFSDTVLGEMWIIKARQPITQENFDEDELPVVFNVKFIGQEMEYQITP